MSGLPDPKERTLKHARRPYRRRVASAKGWERIAAAKMGPCRVCSTRGAIGQYIDLHHLVFREHGGGDVEANIVPLCWKCHDAVHRRVVTVARLLLSRLSDAEYGYLRARGGLDYCERVYGLAYERGTSGEGNRV